MGEFSIYELPVSQGLLALSPLPGRNGDYLSDTRQLRAWQPALVISLTTRDEMAAHEAETLGGDVQRYGARWLHLPTADFDIPCQKLTDRWTDAVRDALHILYAGGKVLVHCKGGCGRSGMAVLRLMVEAGEEPGAALLRLRTVRPCAIETEAQLKWATGGAA